MRISLLARNRYEAGIDWIRPDSRIRTRNPSLAGTERGASGGPVWQVSCYSPGAVANSACEQESGRPGEMPVKEKQFMIRRSIAFFALIGLLMLPSCAKKESSEAPKPDFDEPAPEQVAGAPRALVQLKDGSKLAGKVVVSSPTAMVVAGDDGILRKIPVAQIKSVEYEEAQPAAQPARQAARRDQPKIATQRDRMNQVKRETLPQPTNQVAETTPAAPPPARRAPTRFYELPSGSEVSVRTNETIDSGTAAEGQSFDAQVTEDVSGARGEVVIPRGSSASIVIKSASKGGRFRGASDLVLDLQSVTVGGARYAVEAADVRQTGKAGVGANKRTATYTGGGAAIGAIIGAVAGGGKGAAIGAGTGAGAGALTQILTKGGAIKVPAESVLTFSLGKPLMVTAAE
jgi:hypothetical protein